MCNDLCVRNYLHKLNDILFEIRIVFSFNLRHTYTAHQMTQLSLIKLQNPAQMQFAWHGGQVNGGRYICSTHVMHEILARRSVKVLALHCIVCACVRLCVRPCVPACVCACADMFFQFHLHFELITLTDCGRRISHGRAVRLVPTERFYYRSEILRDSYAFAHARVILPGALVHLSARAREPRKWPCNNNRYRISIPPQSTYNKITINIIL